MKGIMFSEDMFKAVIGGEKTQTRRIIPIDPKDNLIGKGITEWTTFEVHNTYEVIGHYPRYRKEDIVYLKEPYIKMHDGIIFRYSKPGYLAEHKLSDKDNGVDSRLWENKMFMPARYARYFIKITNVRVERVQDISEKDAVAEGVGYGYRMNAGWPDYLNIKNGVCTITQDTAAASFGTLWEKINGKNLWESNPWVWVYEFELIDNIWIAE